MSDESLNETHPMPANSLSAGETMPTSTGGKSTPVETVPPSRKKRRFVWILTVLLAWIVRIQTKRRFLREG
ncbi:MAG TPA: hypothetical protein PK530_17385, partial [Anaerolineales bacterium]|nr:hypothetical protein [Anaerolineales bacterium]